MATRPTIGYPRDQPVGLPVYAPISGQVDPRVYSYHCQYVEGTRTNVNAMQVLEYRLPTPRMFPESGMSRESAVFNITNTPAVVSGAYRMVLNTRFTMTTPVMRIIGSSYYVDVYHVMKSDNINDSDGDIRVDIIDNNTDILSESYVVGNINPNEDSFTNIYKRDLINFRFTNTGQLTFDFWYYGKEFNVVSSISHLSVSSITPVFEVDCKTGIYFTLDGQQIN